MLPIIGIMVGLYIFTRMVDLIGDKVRDAGILLQFCAVVTLVGSLVGILLLIFGGIPSPSLKF